jgi:hypothetical protein
VGGDRSGGGGGGVVEGVFGVKEPPLKLRPLLIVHPSLIGGKYLVVQNGENVSPTHASKCLSLFCQLWAKPTHSTDMSGNGTKCPKK